MGIFNKFKDLVRSQLNDLLDRSEEPEKLHAQRILDLEAHKKTAEKLLIEAMAALKLSEKKLVSFKKDENSSASDFESQINLLQKTIQEEQQAIATLRAGLKALDSKIRLEKSRSTPYLPPEQQDLQNDALHNQHSFDTFERMEEKIEGNEAELEALEELFYYLDHQKAPPQKPQSDLADFEKELSELKKKLKND